MSEMYTALERASERMEYRIAPEVLTNLAKAAEWRVAEMAQEIRDTRQLNSHLADSLASVQHQLATARERNAELENFRELIEQIQRDLKGEAA